MIPQLLRRPYIGATGYQQVQDPAHPAVYGFNLSAPSTVVAGQHLAVTLQVRDTGGVSFINLGAKTTWGGIIVDSAGIVVGILPQVTAFVLPAEAATTLTLSSRSPIGSQWIGQSLTVYVGAETGLSDLTFSSYAIDGTNIGAGIPASLAMSAVVTVVGTSGSSGTSGSTGTSSGGSGSGSGSGETSGFYRASLALISLPTAQANNQPATATVAIANTGSLTGTWTVTGTLGSAQWVPQTVTLMAGVSQTLTMQTNGGINPVNAGRSFPVTFSLAGPGITNSVSGTLAVASAPSSGHINGQGQTTGGFSGGSSGSTSGTGTASAPPAGTTAKPKISTGTWVAIGVGAAVVAGGGIVMATSGNRRAAMAAGYEG